VYKCVCRCVCVCVICVHVRKRRRVHTNVRRFKVQNSNNRGGGLVYSSSIKTSIHVELSYIYIYSAVYRLALGRVVTRTSLLLSFRPFHLSPSSPSSLSILVTSLSVFFQVIHTILVVLCFHLSVCVFAAKVRCAPKSQHTRLRMRVLSGNRRLLLCFTSASASSRQRFRAYGCCLIHV
jgi:hypothetical protein